MRLQRTRDDRARAWRRVGRVAALATALVALAALMPGAAAATQHFVSMPTGNAAQSTPATPAGAGRVIVKYRLSESVGAAQVAAADMGARLVKRIRTFGLDTTGRYVVVSSSTLTTAELMKKYRQDPAVAYVEPDYIIKADDAVTPDDPLFTSQWDMSKIEAPMAWATSTGQSSVVVADIDTGVDYSHPDLAANMWHNPGEIAGNGLDDDGNGYVDDIYGIDAVSGNSDSSDPADDNGHGSHTAGTMAAVGDNGVGVAGVCWTAQIMALKCLNNLGDGYTSDAVTCLDYMTWEKVHGGVNVVAANCSWGDNNYSQTLHDAIAAAGDAGIVVVCAAGNDSLCNDTVPFYPASYDCSNVVSVAATDSTDALASFSNYGASSVDLAAPGVGILSTVPDFVDPSGYTSMDGTSMAAPHVAGALALMAAADPGESMATRIDMLESSVDPVPGLVDVVASGGRLDVAEAVYRGAPDVTGFSPASGPVNTDVVVTGDHFGGATAVDFNGTPATDFSVTATRIEAAVPAGATTGPITVTTGGGSSSSAGSLTVVAAPFTISGFAPDSGEVGSTVVLSGTAFSGATAVAFNGTPATSFTVDSATQITASVPAGATSGTIAVTTPAGAAASATAFTVTHPNDTITGTVTTASGGTLGTACTVTLYAPKGGGWWNSIKTTSTDPITGSYSFVAPGFKAGTYRVRFADPLGDHVPQYYDGAADFFSGDLIDLPAGGTASAIDAALAPAGHVAGIVENAAGAPLSQVSVTAWRLNGGTSGGGDWQTTTGDDGTYDLGGLPAGTCRLSFVSNSDGGYVTQYFDDQPTLDAANDVTVVAGQTTPGIDATLHGGGHITGTVTNPGAGAQNSVWASALQPDGSGGWRLVKQALIGSDGSYDLIGLATGSYVVEFEDAIGNYLTQYYDDAPDPGSAAPVAVTAGQTTPGIDATLAPAGHIRGTVTNASGDGLVDISVTAYQSNGMAGWTIAGLSGYTTMDGSYDLGGLPTGSYYVEFTDFWGHTYLPQDYDGAVARSLATPVAVTAGVATSGIDATLRIGTPPTVTGFAPRAGRVGTTVVITGTGFTGATAVSFNGTAANFTVDSATQITTKVPAGATSGIVTVTTPTGIATGPMSFTLALWPAITRLSPTSGRRGAVVTITGKDFEPKRGTGYVRFGSVKCSRYVSWTTTRIRCRVPAKARLGKVKVVVVTGRGASAYKLFAVKR